MVSIATCASRRPERRTEAEVHVETEREVSTRAAVDRHSYQARHHIGLLTHDPNRDELSRSSGAPSSRTSALLDRMIANGTVHNMGAAPAPSPCAC
jgi:hypothetical protein